MMIMGMALTSVGLRSQEEELLVTSCSQDYGDHNNPSKELSSLLAYPTCQGSFVKYNTTLPSSAPVERLFSIGGLIATLHREKNMLSDTTYKRLLMLKMNCRSANCHLPKLYMAVEVNSMFKIRCIVRLYYMSMFE